MNDMNSVNSANPWMKPEVTPPEPETVYELFVYDPDTGETDCIECLYTDYGSDQFVWEQIEETNWVPLWYRPIYDLDLKARVKEIGLDFKAETDDVDESFWGE